MPILASDKYAEVQISDLLEFNPDDIKLDGTIVACGKRLTGKSWVFRNLEVCRCDESILHESLNIGYGTGHVPHGYPGASGCQECSKRTRANCAEYSVSTSPRLNQHFLRVCVKENVVYRC